MDLGENGNRTNFGQKLTKTGGNRKVMGIVTPNSDMVCGNPQETKINPNKSKELNCKILGHRQTDRPILRTVSALLKLFITDF